MFTQVKNAIENLWWRFMALFGKYPTTDTPDEKPEWMKDTDKVDPVDEAVYESFPASDPPSY